MASEREIVMLTQVTDKGYITVSVDELKASGNIQSNLPSSDPSVSCRIRLGDGEVVELMLPKNDLERDEFNRLLLID